MPKLISINSFNRNDPDQRYKMQSVQVKITEQGQYSTTTIINTREISDDLYHPEDILFKFLGYDLGTMGDIKKKTLKGSYKEEVVQQSIDKYVQNFALCSKCHAPEITPELEGKKKHVNCKMTCIACGKAKILSSDNVVINKTIKLIIKDLQSGREWKKHASRYDNSVDIASAFSEFDDLLF